MNEDGLTDAVQEAGAVELLLIRHGESEGNVAATEARLAGAEVIDVPARDADVNLSGTGRDQAKALGTALAGSPMNSARMRLSPPPMHGPGRPRKSLLRPPAGP